MTKKHVPKRTPYVPPPPVVRTPEEQLRFNVEILIGAIDMEVRVHERRVENASSWIHHEIQSGNGRFSSATSIATNGAVIAEAQGALDAFRKVREWLSPIVKATGASESKEPS